MIPVGVPVALGFGPAIAAAAGAASSTGTGHSKVARKTNRSPEVISLHQHQQTKFVLLQVNADHATGAAVGAVPSITGPPAVSSVAPIAASTVTSGVAAPFAFGSRLTITTSASIAAPSTRGEHKQVAVRFDFDTLGRDVPTFQCGLDLAREGQDAVGSITQMANLQIEFVGVLSSE